MPSKLFLWTSDIFSWSFSANVTNGESFDFYWHFCPRPPKVKVLVILVTVTFIVHFGYEYQW